MNHPIAQAWRARIRATDDWVWLDSPGSAPLLDSVYDSLTQALTQWRDGSFRWQEWDARPQRVRTKLADWLGVEERQVALISSAAEGIATVAAATKGDILVPSDEFRSVLLPLLDRPSGATRRIPTTGGRITTEQILDAAQESAPALVAVSEVLSGTGSRIDVAALSTALGSTRTKLLVDATQSMGVMDSRSLVQQADYVVVHGYKWMMCPRGSAWMIVNDPDELESIAPGWRSGPPPHQYFGGDPLRTGTAADLDSSPAWLSWIGAEAAIDQFLTTDQREIEGWSLELATRYRQLLTELGFSPVPTDVPSPIVVAPVKNPAALAEQLLQDGIKASVFNGNLRVGFHICNTHEDVDRTIDSLRQAEAVSS